MAHQSHPISTDDVHFTKKTLCLYLAFSCFFTQCGIQKNLNFLWGAGDLKRASNLSSLGVGVTENTPWSVCGNGLRKFPLALRMTHKAG